MKTVFRFALPIVLAMACGVSRAEEEFDPAARAAVVAPFIDQTTVAVLHADLSQISVDPLVDLLARIVPHAAENQAETRRALGEFLTVYDQMGSKELYVVISLGDAPPFQPPFIPALGIIPVPQGADLGPMMAFTPKPPPGRPESDVLRRVGDVVCFGSPGVMAHLDTRKPVPRPEFQAAFEAAGDTALQVLIVPPAYTRKLVAQMLPTLPEIIGGGPSRVITQGALWAAVALDLPPELSARVVIQSENPEAAKAFHDRVAGAFRSLGGNEKVSRAVPNLQQIANLLEFQLEGDRLVLSFAGSDSNLRKLLGALQPPLDHARRSAGRGQSVNHLKQLGLAMHNYHDVHKSFPAPANYDADGKPLLSWRVHVLPFLEQNQLYRQFHLDEPWDSEHNRKLIKRMPAVYRSPTARPKQEGHTSYVLPVAEGTAFPGGEGIPLKEIKDGSSWTIMIVEVNDDQAVIWTKPDDLPIDMEDPMKGLGGLYGGEGFNATFCDGSVRFFRSSIDAKLLGSLFTRAGKEVLSAADF